MGAGSSYSPPTFDAAHPFCVQGGTTTAPSLFCRGGSVDEAIGTASAAILMCKPSDPSKAGMGINPTKGAYKCPLVFPDLLVTDLTGNLKPTPLAPALSQSTSYFQVGGPGATTSVSHVNLYPLPTTSTCPTDARDRFLPSAPRATARPPRSPSLPSSRSPAEA